MNLSNINWGEALAFAILGLLLFSAFWRMASILPRKRSGALALALLTLGLWTLDCGLTTVHAAGNGSYLPPQGMYIDGSTNTVVVGTTTNQVSVVAANSTNYFNLTGANQSQADTNAWPKLGFTLGKDEGSPSRILALQTQFKCGGASAGQETLRFAGSVDAIHWQTNPCPFVWNITANGTTQVQQLTNIDTGGYPFFTLFSAENTNAAATSWMTNLWLGSSGKQFE